jgi:hypothetical protein
MVSRMGRWEMHQTLVGKSDVDIDRKIILK